MGSKTHLTSLREDFKNLGIRMESIGISNEQLVEANPKGKRLKGRKMVSVKKVPPAVLKARKAYYKANKAKIASAQKKYRTGKGKAKITKNRAARKKMGLSINHIGTRLTENINQIKSLTNHRSQVYSVAKKVDRILDMLESKLVKYNFLTESTENRLHKLFDLVEQKLLAVAASLKSNDTTSAHAYVLESVTYLSKLLKMYEDIKDEEGEDTEEPEIDLDDIPTEEEGDEVEIEDEPTEEEEDYEEEEDCEEEEDEIGDLEIEDEPVKGDEEPTEEEEEDMDMGVEDEEPTEEEDDLEPEGDEYGLEPEEEEDELDSDDGEDDDEIEAVIPEGRYGRRR